MKAYSTQRLGPVGSWGDAPEPMDTGAIYGVRVDDEETGLRVTVVRRNGVLDIAVDHLDAGDIRRLLTESTIHRQQARMGVKLDAVH